jgi:hypothetical protein
MFVAHFGLGFAAKPLAPRVSLGTLLFAAQFLDLLWPSLLIAGVERVELAPGESPPLHFTHYPVSHSLLAVLAWAIVLGAAHFAFRRSRQAALVVAALVASHWALDLVVHRPDLPLLPAGGPLLGLGLWRTPLVALAAEFAIFAAGVWLYLRATRAVDRVGRYGLAALVAFLVVVQLANVFGAPPPSVEAVAWTGHAQWLLVVWGWWVDAHRAPAAGVRFAFSGP